MSQFTKVAIAASFKKLLSKKTLSSITVNDIVEDCGVNRGTFYYHFHDVYDLMEWIFLQNTNEIFDYANNRTWQESVTKVFSSLIENKNYIINAYHSIDRELLEKFLQKVTTSVIFDKMQQTLNEMPRHKDIEKDSIEFVASIYGYAISGLILDWIKNDMPVERPGEILAQLEKLFPNLFFYTLGLLRR